MGWIDDLIFGAITKDGKRTSDYQYNIIEHTPLLHGYETLDAMYKKATTLDQKASIMLHIDNFHSITNDWSEYQDVKNKIWDDFNNA